ncbi:formate dehydrogenase accessory sulfurtransferase FdhD [Myceligenerans salitolerans]|uniref:Sulfur carrier protein FdhD n=1 Tax=Myceligenerans salitolerans TaxID=1230528 RepID=A0ABS3I636_9MICO|nr:formate dehydrogenase accessory sulfurtransferase FdhD [Myceligenerans salitolerans]MBO0607844.1 formate dehydrogenase accessory sulfurtransferase FdhD [Myceligenerans salitolerans]
MGASSERRRVVRVGPGSGSAGSARTARPDTLAVEEPLMVRLVRGGGPVRSPSLAGPGSEPLTLTMRTPGNDFDLVAGWLVGEGAVGSASDVVGMKACRDEDNTIDVALAPGVVPPRPRAQLTTSACGVCGSDTIVGVSGALRWPVAGDPVRVGADVVTGLPGRLRERQRTFERTGGLHAAGLFTADGEPLYVREDVGRHNAVDKVVGAALRDGRLPAAGTVLQVSGRASFELVQKAARAGIPVLSAISAPSTLAVDLAESCGLTLLGFVRGGSMNVYARADRVR